MEMEKSMCLSAIEELEQFLTENSTEANKVTLDDFFSVCVNKGLNRVSIMAKFHPRFGMLFAKFAKFEIDENGHVAGSFRMIFGTMPDDFSTEVRVVLT